MSSTTPQQRAGNTDHVGDLLERHYGCKGGMLLVGGVEVSQIVEQHGTPVYIYDAAVLDRQWQLLRSTLPARFSIYYSVKANPNQAILKYFVERDCGLEIASGGELQQALTAGCPPERIVFAGPGKTEAELSLALESGVGEIHVESLREARRVADLARLRGESARIALRVNPLAELGAGGLRMGAKAAPFGIDEEQLDDVLDALHDESWLHLAGLHFYLGTQILDYQVLLDQYVAALQIARRAAERRQRPLETIDFGGGLGVPYFAHETRLDLVMFGQGLAQLMNEIDGDPWLSTAQFVVEPGRFLVAEAGIYVTQVTDVKHSRGKKFVILDGGMHHHLAASGNLGQTIKRNFPIAVLNKLDHPLIETVELAGPLCTPLDVIGRALDMPEVQIGDLVGVFQSGAYARSASPLGFLSREAPPEVIVEDAQPRLIRRRGSSADYLSDQPSTTRAGLRRYAAAPSEMRD